MIITADMLISSQNNEVVQCLSRHVNGPLAGETKFLAGRYITKR